MAATVHIHGHIGDDATFAALVDALSKYTVEYEDYYKHFSWDRVNVDKSRANARSILLEKNMQDEGFSVRFEDSRNTGEVELMDVARRYEVDITIVNTEDEHIVFVRNGGDPIKLRASGSRPYLSKDTLQMLKDRGMCTVENIERLLSVMEDAERLPRFTISDDVVREAVVPVRRS